MAGQIPQRQVVRSYASRSRISPATMFVSVCCITIGLLGLVGILWGLLQPFLFQMMADSGNSAISPRQLKILRAAANLNLILSIINIIIAPMLIWAGIKCVKQKNYVLLANMVAIAAAYVLVRYAVRLFAICLPLNEFSQAAGWKPSSFVSYRTLMTVELVGVCLLIAFYAVAFIILRTQIQRQQAIPFAEMG